MQIIIDVPDELVMQMLGAAKKEKITLSDYILQICESKVAGRKIRNQQVEKSNAATSLPERELLHSIVESKLCEFLKTAKLGDYFTTPSLNLPYAALPNMQVAVINREAGRMITRKIPTLSYEGKTIQYSKIRDSQFAGNFSAHLQHSRIYFVV